MTCIGPPLLDYDTKLSVKLSHVGLSTSSSFQTMRIGLTSHYLKRPIFVPKVDFDKTFKIQSTLICRKSVTLQSNIDLKSTKNVTFLKWIFEQQVDFWNNVSFKKLTTDWMKKRARFFFRFLATVKSAFYTLTFICLRGRRHHKWKKTSLRGAISDLRKTL